MKTFLAVTFTALVGSTTFASADSNFTLTDVQTRNQQAELGTVVADSNGVVEIYDFQAGQVGALLGSEALHAGANQDVMVHLNGTPMNQALAVLVIDGQVVATKRIDYNEDNRS